ncbi:hypothetical protein P7266_1067 [Lactococcus cremoris]|nr:hypothetical protein P7266_1067 [Lactococcus cremoris]
MPLLLSLVGFPFLKKGGSIPFFKKGNNWLYPNYFTSKLFFITPYASGTTLREYSKVVV